MRNCKIKSIKKIKHDSKRYDLTIEDTHNFFSNSINVSNCDGQNTSIFSPDGKNTYLKSKKGRPTKDPSELYALVEPTTNQGFKGMGDLIKVMNAAGFPEWIKNIEKLYKSEFSALVAKAKKQNNISKFLGLSLFGEIFNGTQMNLLVYSPEKIGRGAWINFGCVIRDGSASGIDISTTKFGQEIMHEFVDTFNGSSGWKIYYKQMIDIKFNEMFIKGLQNFIDEYRDVIKSRKRNPVITAKKDEARKKLQILLRGFKKDILKQVDKTVSFLGNTEIEGLVMRNMKTGAIIKIVDTGKFTEQNLSNWAGTEELKDTRRTFVSSIFDSILKGADVFMLKGKQIEKLGDYLAAAGKRRFKTMEEVFNVLYKDAASEVQFDDADTIAKNIRALADSYYEDIHTLEKKMRDQQKDSATKITDQRYNSTIQAINVERRKVEEFVSNVEKLALAEQNPLIRVIQYALGGKAIEEFKNRFVQVKPK